VAELLHQLVETAIETAFPDRSPVRHRWLQMTLGSENETVLTRNRSEKA
jgi:hypothetical protein